MDPAHDPLFQNGFFVGVGGIALGVALLTVAAGGRALPAWVRATNGLAGTSALLTWPFLIALRWSPNQWLPGPFYFVIVWGLAIGVWLLVSPGRPAADPD